jgi:POT family proton-dependent oligopeptide transporter
VQTIEAIEAEKGVTLFPEGYTKDKQKVGDVNVIPMERIALAEVKDEAVKIEIQKKVESSLVENAKSFMGMRIATLYDFFMLFVGMAGVSAIILFFLSRKLLQMMHGVR